MPVGDPTQKLDVVRPDTSIDMPGSVLHGLPTPLGYVSRVLFDQIPSDNHEGGQLYYNDISHHVDFHKHAYMNIHVDFPVSSDSTSDRVTYEDEFNQVATDLFGDKVHGTGETTAEYVAVIDPMLPDDSTIVVVSVGASQDISVPDESVGTTS